MTTIPPLTFDQAATAVRDAGFTGWQIVTMTAIGWAESELNLYAINPNMNGEPGDPFRPSWGYPDIGWLQINTYWHPWARDADWWPLIWTAEGNADAARTVFEQGGGLTDPRLGYQRWNTYNTPRYLSALPEARQAARRIGVPV